MIPSKCYVDVCVRFDEGGGIEPLAILWEDGREFEIDRVLDVQNCASEAGGAGRRYIVRLGGNVRNLFLAIDYEHGGILCWYIESLITGGGTHNDEGVYKN